MAKTLQFVVTTNSSPELSAKDQSLIKRHVMKDIGLSRRRYKLPTRSYPQNRKDSENLSWQDRQQSLSSSKSKSSSPAKRSPQNTESSTISSEDESDTIDWFAAPCSSIAAAAIDPFMSLPVPMDAEAGLLIRHVHDDNHAAFKLFREYWYPLAMQDFASMYCALAIAAQHRSTLLRPSPKELAVQRMQCSTYYSAAIKHLQLRLDDPLLSIGEETITAILLLACDHRSVYAMANYQGHMSIISTIIKLRGGLETLESNKKLRLLLFWVDTLGSAVLNQVPRFPAPWQYLPRYKKIIYGKLRPRLSQTVVMEWNELFPAHKQLVEIMDDLCALCAMVEGEARTGKPLQDPRFTGFYTMPLVHRLFSLKINKSPGLQERMVFEASKEAAFILLQLLRHVIAQRYPCLKQPFVEYLESGRTSLAASSVERMETILFGHWNLWTDLLPLKCWVLTMSLNASLLIKKVSSHLHDLDSLADRWDYDALCQSMGLLMNNLATQRFES